MLLRLLMVMLVGLIGCPSTEGGFGTGDADDDDTATVGVPAAIDLGDEIRCANPGNGVFSDVSAAAGIAELPTLAGDYPPDERFDPAPLGYTSTDIENQGGLSVHDFDNDGHLDIAWVQIDALPTLFLGDGALGFSPMALDVPAVHYTGVSAADVDGDGATDLYFGTSEENILLRSTGSGFVDATDDLRLGGGSAGTLTASWADFDRDGDLDVYLANYGEGSPGPNMPSVADGDVLLIGEDGGFVDDPDALPGSSRVGFSYVGGWFDADDDGWLDLYVVTDLAEESSDNLPNHFLHNNRGTLEPGPDQGLDRRMFAMGLALDDMDGDGDVDVHVSNAASTLLARNDDGIFVDISLTVSELSNRPNGDISWATDFVDVDNDGRNELFTAFGHMPTKGPDGGPDGTANRQLQNDTLWRWQPNTEQYEDVAPALGLDDPAWTRTVVPADFDRDGFPEILTWSLNEGLKLHTAGCNDNAWLRVSLRARGSNGAGIGAKLKTSIPGVRVTRHIGAGSRGSMSSQPPEALLGLGSEDTVVLDIVWPDGTVTRNQDVPTRRAVVLTQP